MGLRWAALALLTASVGAGSEPVTFGALPGGALALSNGLVRAAGLEMGARPW